MTNKNGNILPENGYSMHFSKSDGKTSFRVELLLNYCYCFWALRLLWYHDLDSWLILTWSLSLSLPWTESLTMTWTLTLSLTWTNFPSSPSDARAGAATPAAPWPAAPPGSVTRRSRWWWGPMRYIKERAKQTITIQWYDWSTATWTNQKTRVVL